MELADTQDLGSCPKGCGFKSREAQLKDRPALNAGPFVYRKDDSMDKKTLDSVIDFLETYKHVECNPYPDYDRYVWQALSMLPNDLKYLSNYEKLKGKPISEMKRKEIGTMLTFIARGERFCDGHIMGFVESGQLLELMKRLKEIEENRGLGKIFRARRK